MAPRIPITDLERANYTPDSTKTKSITYVRQDGGTDPQFPDKNLIVRNEFLTNPTFGSDQNQDGSAGDITYTWQAPQDNTLIQQVRLLQIADNINDFFDFANIGRLTNGLQFIGSRTAGSNTYANVFDNTDLIQYSTESGGFSFQKQGNNTQDGQLFLIKYLEPILVNSDFSFEIVVRDDLSLISYQRCSILYALEVS